MQQNASQLRLGASPTVSGLALRVPNTIEPSDRMWRAHIAPNFRLDRSQAARVTSGFGQEKVAILLCTFHGQAYLPDQLSSIEAQTHQHWKVWASDDGSSDGTKSILDEFSRRWGPHRLCTSPGPVRGFAANFLSLVCNSEIKADFYAYADQDDVWEADKLQRAVAWLKTVDPAIPALYCSRTRLIDMDGEHIGFSPLFSRPASFANALVQNIGGGNTMLFNNAARKLLCEAGKAVRIASHDWWAYIVVSGCGGQVFYDLEPTLRYRQHSANLVGRNNTLLARANRVRLLWQGRFRHWHDLNLHALQQLRGRLTPENRYVYDQFATARNRWLLPRVIGIKRSGVYRQTTLGNLGLFVAAVFKKI